MVVISPTTQDNNLYPIALPMSKIYGWMGVCCLSLIVGGIKFPADSEYGTYIILCMTVRQYAPLTPRQLRLPISSTKIEDRLLAEERKRCMTLLILLE